MRLLQRQHFEQRRALEAARTEAQRTERGPPPEAARPSPSESQETRSAAGSGRSPEEEATTRAGSVLQVGQSLCLETTSIRVILVVINKVIMTNLRDLDS